MAGQVNRVPHALNAVRVFPIFCAATAVCRKRIKDIDILRRSGEHLSAPVRRELRNGIVTLNVEPSAGVIQRISAGEATVCAVQFSCAGEFSYTAILGALGDSDRATVKEQG